MTIRALVVDDESLARRGLTLRLAAFPDVEIIGQCSNGREALAAIAELHPDLIFLDIQMPGLNGFDVVRALQTEQMPLIVFVTAFNEYALDAFDVHAVDYVLKPVDEERLSKTIDRVKRQLAHKASENDKQRLMNFISDITGEQYSTIDEVFSRPGAEPSYPSRLSIKDKNETTLVDIKDIAWVDAAGDYMCLHTGSQTHIMRCTMKELERYLNPVLFQRIHRSTIINLDHVDKIQNHINGEFFLLLKNGTRLKMSRGYKDKIKHFG
jgi:two-component system, LytTR family, response regulator